VEEIVKADLSVQYHLQAVLTLLNEYAHADAGGVKLSDGMKNCLVAELYKRQDVHIVLGFEEGEPAGMAICFEISSHLSFKPRLCVYDLIVSQAYRGRGLSHRMLAKAEELSAQAGCGKLSIEVQEEIIRSLIYCGVRT
jgi:GNAT superfamily N-acetyltransferase